MDRQLKAWLNQDIVCTPWISFNGAGDNTYGTQVTYKGYVYEGTESKPNGFGEQFTSKLRVIMAEDAVSITKRDLLTLPDGVTRSIEKCTPYYDEKGSFDFLEVILTNGEF